MVYFSSRVLQDRNGKIIERFCLGRAYYFMSRYKLLRAYFVDINDEIPLEKKTRDNCRLISVYIKVVKPILLLRDVKFDNLTLQKYLFDTQYFNHTINEIKFLEHYSSSDNNAFAEGIDVYMDGMTNEKLKNFFGDDKITVTWVDLLNRKHKQIFYLKDYFL